jgi:hypothetical protein
MRGEMTMWYVYLVLAWLLVFVVAMVFSTKVSIDKPSKYLKVSVRPYESKGRVKFKVELKNGYDSVRFFKHDDDFMICLRDVTFNHNFNVISGIYMGNAKKEDTVGMSKNEYRLSTSVIFDDVEHYFTMQGSKKVVSDRKYNMVIIDNKSGKLFIK